MMRTFFVQLCIVLLPVCAFTQSIDVTVSGIVRTGGAALPYVNVVIKTAVDSVFVSGTVTNDAGRFSISSIRSGNYTIEVFYTGYNAVKQPVFVGGLSAYLELPAIELKEITDTLAEVRVTAKQDELSNRLDKKSYDMSEQVARSGGSVLQAMQNLPGVTVQDGKVQLRGNEKITVLIDGKQTALTGFSSQTGLDNIPASAIEKIEIINNPSSKYDANGNAGIINIIMKKSKDSGLSGKAGLTLGAGALWVRKENLPTIRAQYTVTPKLNPSLSVNYRKNKLNLFLQADDLYTQTLNKNEFVTRTYDDGTIIHSQLKRNRNTNFFNSKAGVDWSMDEQNILSLSGLYGNEKIIDRGDQPFFDQGLSNRLRLWQFLEDELKTTVMATAAFQHRFKQPGHLFNLGLNYTFHREDEKYYYDNFLPSSTGTDAFKLLSDEQVYDLNADYIRPLKHGHIETGIKLRSRSIPTNMHFIPGSNSVLDTNAGGWATYKELIPAAYANYVYETVKWEAELGIRAEYVRISYDVNPGHNTYKSDGYDYTQPFPNLRLAYKFNAHDKLTLFYNRRVDRPNEVDIRIFPKYDDAEIIKVGNPALRPQFTNAFEIGGRHSWTRGYLYAALYHRVADGTITRISTVVPGSTLVYAVFQNAGKSYNSGAEVIWNQKVSKSYSYNINGNIYRNRIDAFSVLNLYPQPTRFSANEQTVISGNLKWNNQFHFTHGIDAQLAVVYLAPDIIPQGRIRSRFGVDIGVKKSMLKGKADIFFSANDLLNTMVIRKQVTGVGFRYTSDDYNETQVVRLGFNYKF